MISSRKKTKFFIISGPSGAGEDSIIAGLRQRIHITVAVTTTTRSMRPGESQCNPYYFVSAEEFKARIAKNDMAEWAQHYNGNYYGVTRMELQRIQESGGVGIWKIDYKGVIAAKKLFPHVVAIFVMADSLEELERRIRGREHVTEEYVTERMTYSREWLRHTDIYDYTVINKRDCLDQAIEEVEGIIRFHCPDVAHA